MEIAGEELGLAGGGVAKVLKQVARPLSSLKLAISELAVIASLCAVGTWVEQVYRPPHNTRARLPFSRWRGCEVAVSLPHVSARLRACRVCVSPRGGVCHTRAEETRRWMGCMRWLAVHCWHSHGLSTNRHAPGLSGDVRLGSAWVDTELWGSQLGGEHDTPASPREGEGHASAVVSPAPLTRAGLGRLTEQGVHVLL
jgi:hypothetical protein